MDGNEVGRYGSVDGFCGNVVTNERLIWEILLQIFIELTSIFFSIVCNKPLYFIFRSQSCLCLVESSGLSISLYTFVRRSRTLII